MTNHWGITLFMVTVIGSCAGQPPPSRTSHPNTFRGIALQTEGPRGGGYADTNGKEFGYRIFRVHAINDSTVPAELTMTIPGGPIALLPDTDKYINVFLFPDEISPDTAQDVFNYGITGSEDFIRTRPDGPTALRATIPPGGAHTLYIGMVFAPRGLNGLGRAELFVNGQKPNASFFPEGSAPTGTAKGNDLDLLFGVAIDPPQHYSMVPCGRITFKEQ